MLDNHLLEKLSGNVAADIRRRLKPFDFIHGDILAEPNTVIDRMIFPRSGLISIVVELDSGDQIEAGIVGRRGALGGAAIFGAEHHLHAAVSQVSGGAWSMPIADAKDLASTSAQFRGLILAQEQYLLAEAWQFAACNAKHLVIQRLCSWLLRARDEAGGSELLMIQENMAKMLGVQRASVSMLASQLQEEGLISYRRGRIHVSDPEGLRDRACSCYRTLGEQHEHLFAGRTRRNIGADRRHGDGPAEGPSLD